MNLGKHTPSLVVIAAGIAILTAGEARGGLDSGLGDLQVVLPYAAAADKTLSSAEAQLQIRCTESVAKANVAVPKALSTHPTQTSEGQVTWSTDNGKQATDSNGRLFLPDSKQTVVVYSSGLAGH